MTMRRLFVILLTGCVFAACGTRPETTLRGTVTGIADGTKVVLYDNEGQELDSTAVKGGKFRFEIAKVYPDRNLVWFEGMQYPFPFIVERGVITGTVNGEAGRETAVFTGTTTNDGLKAIEDGIAPLTARMDEIAGQVESMPSGTPEYDALLSEYYGIYDEKELHREKAARENPDTILAAYIIYGNAHALTTPAEMDSVLMLVGGAPDNAFVDRLRERRELLAKAAVGGPAPDFTQNRPDGTPFTLSSLRGKLVLVDFWASWCGPCRAENPNVVKVYNRFKNKGFEIVGVSLDNNREAWLKAIADDGLTWVHVSDIKGWENEVAQQYAVRSIPHTVLVGPDGVILAKNLRGAALEAKIAEVLK